MAKGKSKSSRKKSKTKDHKEKSLKQPNAQQDKPQEDKPQQDRSQHNLYEPQEQPIPSDAQIGIEQVHEPQQITIKSKEKTIEKGVIKTKKKRNSTLFSFRNTNIRLGTENISKHKLAQQIALNEAKRMDITSLYPEKIVYVPQQQSGEKIQAVNRTTKNLRQIEPKKLGKRDRMLLKEYEALSYELQAVVGKRHNGQTTEYEIKWMNYPTSKNTWQQSFNLLGAASEVHKFEEKNRDYAHLPSTEEFKILSWRQSRRGLINIDNNCYLNAALQVLNKTPEITRGCIQSEKDNPFLKQFIYLNLQLIEKNGIGFYPLEFITLLNQKHDSKYVLSVMHDSAEVLATILDDIAQITNTVEQKHDFYQIQDQGQDDEDLFNLFKQRQQNKQKSFIHDIVYGWYKVTFDCSKCGRSSRVFQRFSILHIEVVSDEQNSPIKLEDCIQKSFTPQLLQDQNQRYCQKCKKKTDCSSHMSLFKVSPILIICLKRFRADSKVKQLVNCPNKFDSTLCEGKLKNYRLYGMVEHIGDSKDSGHYIAVCQVNRKWMFFDDQKANCIPEPDVRKVSRKSYILFYGKT